MIHDHCNTVWSKLVGIPERTGDVGVELEIEGLHLPTELTGWLVKHEGSLRGKGGRVISEGENQIDTPHEYVCSRPVGLGLLEKKLQHLHRALTKPPTEVSLTDRASTHIHVNMTNNTLRQVLGYIVIYLIVEPVLLRLCGPKRNGNLFCLPSYETGDMQKQAETIVWSITDTGVRRYWPSRRGKYAAMNLDTLTNLGSIELRCFPNSIDPEIIHRWATWVVNIRTLAEHTTEATYMSVIDRAYDDTDWILRRIFGSYAKLHSACSPNNPYELINFGIEGAYEVAKVFLKVLDYKPPSKNPKKSLSAFGFNGDSVTAASQWDIPEPPEPYYGEED